MQEPAPGAWRADGEPSLASTHTSRPPRGGLVVFALVVGIVMVSGALLAMVPIRSCETNDAFYRSASHPVGTVAVVELDVGDGVDARGRVVPATVVPSSCSQIEVAANVQGMQEAALPVAARLVRLAGPEPFDSLPLLVDRDKTVSFTFARGKRAWPTGRYRAEVLLNSFEAAYTEFDVR